MWPFKKRMPIGDDDYTRHMKGLRSLAEIQEKNMTTSTNLLSGGVLTAASSKAAVPPSWTDERVYGVPLTTISHLAHELAKRNINPADELAMDSLLDIVYKEGKAYAETHIQEQVNYELAKLGVLND